MRTGIATISFPAAALALSLAAHDTGGPTIASVGSASSSEAVNGACIAYDKPAFNELDNGEFSERIEAGGIPQQVADEFVLPSGADIQRVSWSGSYYQSDLPSATTHIDFRIRFFADAGGKPEPTPLYDELVSAQVINSGIILNNRIVYLFEADLASAVGLDGGDTHWISVLEEDTTTHHYPLAWRWANSTTGSGDAYAARNTDDSNWSLWYGRRANKAFQLDVCPSEAAAAVVGIDIKPGSDRNPVNLRSRGRIPVVILTTSDFDASAVDPSTVTLGNAEGADTPVAAHRNGRLMASLEDVDDDGDLDLVMHFDTARLVANGDLDAHSTQLILNGGTTDGLVILGSDMVTIVRR